MKFTDASIRNLKARPERYIEWKDHGDGLGVRVSPKGRKTFIFMYRYEGRPRMMSLGVYPGTTLAMAHKAHAAAMERLEQGADPGTEHTEKRKEERDAHTIPGLIDEYLERYARKKKKSWKEDERILKREVEAAWGKRKAKDIKRRDVINLLDRIVDRGAPIQANRTLAAIRKMYNFAISRDIVESSPCQQVTSPAKENTRERHLDKDEIRAFWNKLAETDIPQLQQLSLKFELVTGQRPGEVASLMESEIDGDWWEIPATKTKNGLPHRVWLSGLAQAILEDAKKLTEGLEEETVYVFPSFRTGGPVEKSTLPRVIKRNLSVFEIPPFTPHDLRRTVTTHLHEMGFSTHLVSKLLNHKERGVTGLHYNKHDYVKEKTQMLDTWARRLDGIINDKRDNVVNLVK